MASYPLPCGYCDHVADSLDSLADTRADLAVHVYRRHPGAPLPGTWTVADVESIPGVKHRFPPVQSTPTDAGERP